MSQSTLKEVSIAGKALDRFFHVCAFFDSRDEEYSVLGPYYKEGFVAGEKALHIVDSAHCEDHRQRLTALGVDVTACEKSGQLELTTPQDTYLAGGVFEPNRMLISIDRGVADAKERGFRRTRIMGKMDWAFMGAPGSDRLIEYEILVNEILARTRQPAICVYDAAQLTGAMMLDILRCHPLTLVNGAVHENPFFTPPDIFLAELRQRDRPRALS